MVTPQITCYKQIKLIYQKNIHKMTYLNKTLVIPMRPIVSCINSATYNLSKLLEKAITPLLVQSDYYARGSWSFAKFIHYVYTTQ